MVSAPIYSIPRPLNRETATRWIIEHETQRKQGEGLLLLAVDETGEVTGEVDVEVWPDLASAEFGGALRVDIQNQSQGAAGADLLGQWLFEEIGIRLIAMTAALDNVRTHRLLDRLGFVRMGERDCIRPDGTVRPSLYWELRRVDWRLHRTDTNRKGLPGTG